mmetsp:Transcript_86761/g.229896  ORF Transcript_86761/g.229896 Transcript_86761/m.229896 type:complete len:347 (+) Transcript_86761:320-1360(+)
MGWRSQDRLAADPCLNSGTHQHGAWGTDRRMQGFAHCGGESRLLRGEDEGAAADLLVVPRLLLQGLRDFGAGAGQADLHTVAVEHHDDVPQGLQAVGVHPRHVLHGEHHGPGAGPEDALHAVHVPIPGQEVQLPEELVEEDAITTNRWRETLLALACEQFWCHALLPTELIALLSTELVKLRGIRHVRVAWLRVGQLRLQLRLLGGLILRGVRVLPLLARQVHLVDLEGIDGDHLGRPVREPLVARRRDRDLCVGARGLLAGDEQGHHRADDKPGHGVDDPAHQSHHAEEPEVPLLLVPKLLHVAPRHHAEARHDKDGRNAALGDVGHELHGNCSEHEDQEALDEL